MATLKKKTVFYVQETVNFITHILTLFLHENTVKIPKKAFYWEITVKITINRKFQGKTLTTE